MASSKPERTAMVTYGHRTRQEIQKCPQHPYQNANAYCDTCKQLVCGVCSPLDHGKHSLIDLSEAVDKCKQHVAELAAKLEMDKVKLKIAMIDTFKSHQKLDTMFGKTKEKISQKADEEITRIREEEQELKKKAEQVYEDTVTTLDTATTTNRKKLSMVEHKLDVVNQMMNASSCHDLDILRVKDTLELWIKQTGGQPTVSGRLPFMDFEEGEQKSLGRLKLEDDQHLQLQVPVDALKSLDVNPSRLCPKEEWKLEETIKEFELKGTGGKWTEFRKVYDVASFSNNDLITVDTGHNRLISSQHIIRTHRGIRKHSFEFKSEQIILSIHRSISVNKDDWLIILKNLVGFWEHGSTIKCTICNRKCEHLHSFSLPTDDLKALDEDDNKPTCFAVDDSSQIAIGYENTEEIRLHSPDGSLINTVSARKIAHYLTIYKQRLIYTNWESKKLLSVDYNGSRAFSVDIPCKQSWWGPTGVCCDSNGNIYVAVCGKWPSMGEIQRFSPDGRYLGCVVEKVSTLYGITLTPNGESLVAAGGNSILIFCRI